MVTAAVIGSAVVGAAGSMAAADSAGRATQNAANTAASTQQQQLQAQIALQQQALAQQSQLSAPYRSLGQSAIPQLEGMLGITGQPVTNTPPPLVGAPGQGSSPYSLAQYAAGGVSAPYGGGGPLGGAGVPTGAGPQYGGGAAPNPLSAIALGGGAYAPMNGISVQPGAQMPPQAGSQVGGLYNPPAPTLNGVPSYSQVLGGYGNLLGQLESAVGLGGGGGGGGQGGAPGGGGQGGAPNTDAMISSLRNSPGYQWQLSEANDNAKAQAAAMGMSLSGNTLQSLSEVGQGLADSTYQQYLGNIGNTIGAYQGYVGDYQNYLGQLMNSITLGQGAAAGQAANIGNSASALGASFQNTGNNLAQIATNQGNTMAGINANEIAGLTKAAGNVGNYYTMQNTLNALNNPNGQSLYQGAPTPSPISYGGAQGTTTDFNAIDGGGTTTYFGAPA